MKHLILAAAVSLLTTTAFAGATLTPKANGSNSNGAVGYDASRATGNGDWVGGNGTQDGVFGAGDQTTYPGSRADLVRDLNNRGGNKD